MSSLFDTCVAQGQGNDTRVLQCITNSLVQEVKEVQASSSNEPGDTSSLAAGVDMFFLIYAASLMFCMQGGFAMLCAGCVRKKNVQNTLLKNLLDACGAAFAFFSVGFAFSYGGQTESGEPTTFIGNEGFFLIGTDDYAFFVYQVAFAATASTIVAGTLAERCQMAAYLCFSIGLTSFVYPVIVHAVWNNNGILSPFKVDPLWGTGMIDFAGSGVVHITGGITALIASYILGPRQGRFREEKGHPLGTAVTIEGHSSSLQTLGTFLLWFGWYGFNAGSILHVSTETYGYIASLSAVSTTMGAAAGALASLAASAYAAKRKTGETEWRLSDGLNGTLTGLVAITGGCGVYEPWAAALVGAIGGVQYVVWSRRLLRWRIDDACDAIPVHLGGGIWGVIAVGLFASPRHLQDAYGRSEHVGWVYSWGRGSADATLLAINIVGILFIVGWVFFLMTPLFLFLRFMGWFRADSLEEIIGLDPESSDKADGIVSKKHQDELQKRIDARSKGAQISDTFQDNA